MKIEEIQKEKATRFRDLHHGSEMLVLPNIWDPLGAALLEDLGYRAVATASASVAFTGGYDDGENIPFEQVLERLLRIVNSVAVPVTADIESGYCQALADLENNIKRLIATGVVGINFEDYNPKSKSLFSLEEQCDRIHSIREIAKAAEIHLFINARTDVYLRGNGFSTDEEKLSETIRRGKAYLEAGADCLFPPAMKMKADLKKLIEMLKCPVNVLALPGIPDFKSLDEIGVARVSLGPGFLKVAVKAMKELAIKLKNHEGLEEVIASTVTSADLRKLVTATN